jgi:stage V sporulation protein B
MRKQNFVQGTVLLIVIMAIVKFLGMINRFIIARVLTPEGFGLHMLVMPTFILLISLAQLGFPISISKLVSENRIKKTLTNKGILLGAVKISLLNSAVLITILLLSARFLATSLLHDERAFYPILALSIFIPLVAFSSILKGYLHGLKIIDIPAYSQLVEQLVRIIASIGLVMLLLPYGIPLAVTGSILAISLGEIASIIFLITRLVNRKNITYILKPNVKTVEPIKEILSISIPATGSRLIGAVTHFFEPIIFATAMAGIGISSAYTTRLYGQISGYVISTLIVPSFVVVAISTTLLPVMTEQFARNNFKKIQEYFNISIFLSYMVGALYIIMVLLFPNEIMKIFFGTTEGVEFLIYMAPVFILYYFEQPIAQTLHAVDQTKKVMIKTLISNTIKLFLMYFLVSQKSIHVYGFVIAVIINILMITLLNYILLKKTIKIKANWSTIVLSILLLIITLVFGLILKEVLTLHFILIGIIVVLFYLALLFGFNIGQIRDLRKNLMTNLQHGKQ